MAMWTMGPIAQVFSSQADPYIVLVGHEPEMLGIYTATHPAAMVDFEVLRYDTRIA